MEYEDISCLTPARATTYKHIHSGNLARAEANQDSLAEEMAEDGGTKRAVRRPQMPQMLFRPCNLD